MSLRQADFDLQTIFKRFDRRQWTRSCVIDTTVHHRTQSLRVNGTGMVGGRPGRACSADKRDSHQ